MSAMDRFNGALAEVIREQSDELVRQAYGHGYKAGVSSADVDRAVYRRGYLAGYNAARRGAPSYPDGAPSGRERFATIGAAS